jgi:flagellar biosynthesis/type III secretory pathway M-ring protein FliF/YscJ
MAEQVTALVGPVAVFGFAFLLMWAMWRQMRRVRAHTAEQARHRAERAEAHPPIEEWDAEQGRYVRRDGEPNEELLRQGARSRASGWPLDP